MPEGGSLPCPALPYCYTPAALPVVYKSLPKNAACNSKNQTVLHPGCVLTDFAPPQEPLPSIPVQALCRFGVGCVPGSLLLAWLL
jgi:hypothetical protein